MPEQDRADARAHRRRCRATTAAGRSRSSGTACARSRYVRGRPAAAAERATATTSRRATRSCARSAAALGAPRGGARRRGRRLRRRRAAELPAPPAAACTSTSERAVRRLARADAGRLRDLRPALPRRPLADGPALRASAASGSPSSSSTGPTWQTPAHHVGDGAALLEADRARRGSRASSPSGSTARTCRAGARRGWVKVKNVRRQDVVIGGWLPGEGGRARPARRARRRLPRRRRRRCATPAGSAPASPRPSSTRSAALLEPLARDDSPVRRAASRRSATRFVEPRARRRGRVHASGRSARHAAPPVLQGPARRHRAGGRRAARGGLAPARHQGAWLGSNSRSRRCSC